MILPFQSSIPLKQLLSTIWNLWFVKEMGENPYTQILWKLENKNSVYSGNFVICIYNFWNSPWRVYAREIFGREGIIIQFRLSPQSINQSVTDCPILGFLFFSVRVHKFHNTIRGWQAFTKALPRVFLFLRIWENQPASTFTRKIWKNKSNKDNPKHRAPSFYSQRQSTQWNQ